MGLISNRAHTGAGAPAGSDVRNVKTLLSEFAISGFDIVRAPAKTKEAIALGWKWFRQRLVDLDNQVSTSEEHES